MLLYHNIPDLYLPFPLLLSQIEDTKGNDGEQGQLTMTNLRLMWVSDNSHRTNLTLGYNCIVSINVKEAASRLRGGIHNLTKCFFFIIALSRSSCILSCRVDSGLVCAHQIPQL